MKSLTVDIETFSSVDIASAGAYKYADSEDFEILLFAYKEDDADTEVIDLTQETFPERIKNALSDPAITKRAYNAAFEWYCLNKAGYDTPIWQWECSMIHAAYLGYPMGLEKTGEAMGIAEEKKKLMTGKALIRYFCQPCKPTKSNGGRTRNLPHHDPDKWDLFKEYNIQDVEAEYAIDQKIKAFPVPDEEWQRFYRDTVMNERGVKLDRELIGGALSISNQSTEALMDQARTITRLTNPNSNVQMLEWVNKQGVKTDNLQKATVAELLDTDIPDEVRTVLNIRQKLSKTSTKKYQAMENAIGADDRARGLLQFYGANRTGRYAGRLIQVQNLPRNYIPTLDNARSLVKNGDADALAMIYGNVPDTLSQLIRTAFIPSDGNHFIVCDFSAIEARVLAWLAGEKWVLDAFSQGRDIYCETASMMFSVPVKKHGQNSELRQKGKIATLACGYQGSVGAMKAMGALNMGLSENDLQGIVDAWRNANTNIVSLWWTLEKQARNTITTGGEYTNGKITFRLETDGDNTYFTVELPSGRKLFYNDPMVTEDGIVFVGQNQTTRKWELQETYGGKLTENIVQAIARDILTDTMTRVENAGYNPVMHIHDEIVIDATPEQHLEDVINIFREPIPWAEGLPLDGDGFEGRYYKKD